MYLSRKLKIPIAVPPTHDVDVYAHDIGFIAMVNERDDLVGFNIITGGGMGVTHGNKKTSSAQKFIQRDNVDRKTGRLKYTIDRMGVNTFKAEVEKLSGFQFQPAQPYTFGSDIDDFWLANWQGWQPSFYLLYRKQSRAGRNWSSLQDRPARDFQDTQRRVSPDPELAPCHLGNPNDGVAQN
ncbi:hypothetical protein BGW80DRAFT_1522046 [Lactifluus volemus]|nr:hypothetical protein BGW80DRAFT_1522046 [Lactifluus volemus]